MATPRKARTVEGETVDIPPNIPLMNFPAVSPGSHAEVEEFDDVSSLNAVLDELGADEVGGFVVVYRETVINGRKGDDEYLDRYPVGEFSLNGLKSQWGAGKYKVNVYRSGGGGLAARKVITIAKDPTAAVVAPVAQPAALDLTPVITAIQQSSEKTLQAILALAQGAQQKTPSRTEMLSELQIMREMFAPVGQTAPVNFNPVEMLKLGMEMAGNGGGESNNAWATKLIEQFGPLLVPLVTNNIEKQATHHAPRPALAAPQLPPGHPEAAPIPTPQPEENPVSVIVGNYLKLLARAAEQKAPVEEYADSILASVPESYVPDIEKMLRPDDWRDQVRRFTPAVDQHAEWFTGLRDTLLAYIDEDKALASTHLTGVPASGSVPAHENANTAATSTDAGVPGSAT